MPASKVRLHRQNKWNAHTRCFPGRLGNNNRTRTFSNSRRMGLMKVADTCCAASCPSSMARDISGTYSEVLDLSYMLHTSQCCPPWCICWLAT